MTTGGLSLCDVTSCRVMDTRQLSGTPPLSGVRDVTVSGACGVQNPAQAYVWDATAVPPGPLGFLTLWAQAQTQPSMSTLNVLDAAVTSKLAIVPTSNGRQ